MFYLIGEHERAVVRTLGRMSGLRGPGLIVLVAVLQQIKRVDIRETEARALPGGSRSRRSS